MIPLLNIVVAYLCLFVDVGACRKVSNKKIGRKGLPNDVLGGEVSMLAQSQQGAVSQQSDHKLANRLTGGPWNRSFQKFRLNGEVELNYWGLMLAGAIARSVASTAVHPLYVIKTLLQTNQEGWRGLPSLSWSTLTRGANTQLIISLPHGAMNFAAIELTKKQLAQFTSGIFTTSYLLTALLDFLAQAIATLFCSSISTPQMVLTDRMAVGYYNSFLDAVRSVWRTQGILGFYSGWLPGMLQKIPSYGLTWMFFQQIKALFFVVLAREGRPLENTVLGAIAASVACCIMNPIDTIKTRLVMPQSEEGMSQQRYLGILDCFRQIYQAEGVEAFYRSLPPRLLSVVPMIGLQFATYEFVKKTLLQQPPPKSQAFKLGQKRPPGGFQHSTA